MSEELSDILAAAEMGDNILSRLEMIVVQLLEKDPEKLIHALYRVDVDEKKIKVVLQNHSGDAAKDIAQLLALDALIKFIEIIKSPHSEDF